jgi:hypothetical protein
MYTRTVWDGNKRTVLVIYKTTKPPNGVPQEFPPKHNGSYWILGEWFENNRDDNPIIHHYVRAQPGLSNIPPIVWITKDQTIKSDDGKPSPIMLCEERCSSGVKSVGDRSCSVGYSGTPGVNLTFGDSDPETFRGDFIGGDKVVRNKINRRTHSNMIRAMERVVRVTQSTESINGDYTFVGLGDGTGIYMRTNRAGHRLSIHNVEDSLPGGKWVLFNIDRPHEYYLMECLSEHFTCIPPSTTWPSTKWHTNKSSIPLGTFTSIVLNSNHWRKAPAEHSLILTATVEDIKKEIQTLSDSLTSLSSVLSRLMRKVNQLQIEPTTK